MKAIITWSELTTYLFLFLLFYYTAVLVLFYRHELVKLAGRFKSNVAPVDDDSDLPEQEASNYKEQFLEQVQNLMKDCNAIFSNITNAPLSREKLVSDIKSKVGRYPQIKDSEYQISLTNHIEQEAENRLGIKLSEEELEAIWE